MTKHKSKYRRGSHDGALRGSTDTAKDSADEDSDDDQDEDDEDDDEDDQKAKKDLAKEEDKLEKRVDTHEKERLRMETEIIDANKALTANQKEQLELKLSLARVSNEKKSDQEIEANAKLVANETESPAMANMLGKMWKEMRMFEVPFYAEHVQEELHHLKRDERNLQAKVDAAEEKLAAAKKRWAAEAKREKEGEGKEDEAKKGEEAKEDKDGKGEEAKKEKPEKAPEKEQNVYAEVKDAESSVQEAPLKPAQIDFWAMNARQKRSALTSTLVYLVCGILVAWLYKTCRDRKVGLFVSEKKPDVPKDSGFTFSILGCFGDFKICLAGCLCPSARWADTIDTTRAANGRALLSYWRAFLIFFGLMLLHIYTWGFSSFCIVLLGTYFRQKIRKAYGITSGNASTFFEDFLMWCCCLPCAIIQEAREGVQRRDL